MTSRSLPRDLYRAEQVRALDACAINDFGIPGMTLMERAGQAAFGIIQRRWPRAARIVVFCGRGNNGGDGYVIAGLARRAGKDVTVVHVGPRDALAGDARTAMQLALAAQVRMVDALDPAVSLDFEADLVVDALLGTGLSGPVRADYLAAIEAVNAMATPVLAIDIPSGLCSDTGTQLGSAVRADATVTFIGLKQGCFTGRGPALCGDVYFDDLRVPADVYARVPRTALRIDESLAGELLARRERDSHKGRYGHVLVIGGEAGFAGAPLMAAEAAARAGAGLVSIATRPEHVAACIARRPEMMALGVTHPSGIDALLAKATVVAIGPGLGTSAWSRALLDRVLATDLPLVLDADALNLVARDAIDLRARAARGAGFVLTPHPGEAARLLDIDSASVQADRFAVARRLQEKLGGVVLLKGAGTVIDAGPGRDMCVATVGNPGMASGGMGDVLSGLIAGFIAQGCGESVRTGEASQPASCPCLDATRLAAVVHGAAADRCARIHGERGMLATDLLPYVRELVNGLGVDSAARH